MRWSAAALPRDYATLAPQVVHFASEGDPVAVQIMRAGARHIDAIAARLVVLGIDRLALVGGLAEHMKPWLAQETRARLVPAAGDALQGALVLARMTAQGTGVATGLGAGETAA